MRAPAWTFQRRVADEGLRTPTRMGGQIGARDASGQQIPYTPDPLRNRSMSWNPGGYMSAGYDTGRVL